MHCTSVSEREVSVGEYIFTGFGSRRRNINWISYLIKLQLGSGSLLGTSGASVGVSMPALGWGCLAAADFGVGDAVAGGAGLSSGGPFTTRLQTPMTKMSANTTKQPPRSAGFLSLGACSSATCH